MPDFYTSVEREHRALNANHSFRPHRGGYDESAAERCYFNDRSELVAHLYRLARDPEKMGDFPTGPFRSRFYGEDSRMTPSESHMVLDYLGRPVGFSSLPLLNQSPP